MTLLFVSLFPHKENQYLTPPPPYYSNSRKKKKKKKDINTLFDRRLS